MNGSPQHLCLKYDRPAEDWQSEALPIGNGRLGAMIFGGVRQERLQINESSLWTGDERLMGSYQALGTVALDFGHDAFQNYERRLDLNSAIHTVEYSAGGGRFTRECFASHPDEVLVLRLTADHPNALSVRIHFQDAHGAPSICHADQIVCRGSLNNGLLYETRVALRCAGGEVSSIDGGLQITAADSICISITARTNYSNCRESGWRGMTPQEQMEGDRAGAINTPFISLRERHISDYQRLFERVRLILGSSANARVPLDQRIVQHASGAADPELAAMLFQYGRYLLIASSRQSLPANLQGLWNDSNSPPWCCDYHSNINVQMNYWPAEVANLAECALPFFEYVASLRDVRREQTQAYYLSDKKPVPVPTKPVRGWTVQTENNIFGGSAFKWNPPGSAWYCLQIWEHFAFSQDERFLRDVAYPVIKEVCEFWEDHLIALPDGRLVSPDGWSPEHGPDEPGVTYDQEIVWNLLNNFIDASQRLWIDAAFRQRMVETRARLLKPTIGRWGQLQEWMQDVDDPGDRHRHVSHLFSLHPGREISPATTPALAEAARVSLAARGDESTGWAIAWRINFWARLLDGDHALALLKNFLRPVTAVPTINYERGGGVYSNLLCAHPPFQIDGNFGVTAGIAEMLLQSHCGFIHLLPALPTAWPEGEVSGLRARGGFVIDIKWRDGRLFEALIQATCRNRCRIRSEPEFIGVTRDGGPAEMLLQDDVIEFDAEAGVVYRLVIRPPDGD